MKKTLFMSSGDVAISYGPELVTNGTFDTDLSGWTADAWWVWDANGGDGRAYHPSSGDYKAISQNPATLNGSSYKFNFDLTRVTGDIKIRYKNGAGGNVDTIYTTSGLKEIIITDIQTGTAFFFSRNTLTTEFYIDNVSVREIL